MAINTTDADPLYFRQLGWYWQEESTADKANNNSQDSQQSMSELNSSQLNAFKSSSSQPSHSQPNSLKTENSNSNSNSNSKAKSTQNNAAAKHAITAKVSTGNPVAADPVEAKLAVILQQPGIAALSANYYKKAEEQYQNIIAQLARQRRQAMQLVQVTQSLEFSKLPDCHDPQTDKLLKILQSK